MKTILQIFILLLFNFFAFGQVVFEGTSNKVKLNITKAIIPPQLIISKEGEQGIKLVDENNSGRVDAEENATIEFNLLNKGKGVAKNIIVTIDAERKIKGLNYQPTTTIGNIEPGGNTKVKLQIRGASDLETGNVLFTINVKEQNGFDADPILFKFTTLQFKSPELRITDFQFINSDGIIKVGLPISLKLLVQNLGQGGTDNVSISFDLPENVYPTGDINFNIGKMGAGDHKELNDFGFTANKKYSANKIPINVHIKEKFGRFGIDTTIYASVNQKLQDRTLVEAKTEIPIDKVIKEVKLSSDVDRMVPNTGAKKEHAYAVIIGNEDYKSHQSGLTSEPNVQYAANDARIFKEYCVKTFGIPERNITFYTDATAGTMNQSISLLNKEIKNEEGEAEVIFYYAGHGQPDEETKEPYIIPVDVNGKDLQNAIKLKNLYAKLSEYPSKKITVILDACFSGGGRGEEGLVAARMMRIKPKEVSISGNMVVFTSSSGEESSLPYDEEKHGMFTFFLLKKLQETKGKVSYEDLYKFVKKEVGTNCLIINKKEQNPQLLQSDGLSDNWKNWQFVDK